MDIVATHIADLTTMRLKGRLDAYWSDHVGNAIEQLVRGGAHHLELDFSEVDYLSSAGIRVLLQHYKNLKAIQGSLRVIKPSPFVARTLSLSGFDGIFLPAKSFASEGASSPASAARVERAWGTMQVHEQASGATMSCQVLGSSDPFFSGRIESSQAVLTAFPANTMGFGLGAFGRDFSDCENRFGEFLTVGGAALAMPTDGSNVPDHMLANQDLVPELVVLYGLRASGQFSHMARFDSRTEPGAAVTMVQIAEAAFEITNSQTVCLCVLAECGAIVGASLRQSPALAAGGKPLLFPQVREWISLTTDRASDRHVTLITGVASKGEAGSLAPLLRRVAPGSEVTGHFHAAIFPYAPLPRGELQLQAAVASLMNTQSAQGLLHLLCDDRPFDGAGDSELFRGACWVGRATESSITST
jgi:anti-anti-sigma factor